MFVTSGPRWLQWEGIGGEVTGCWRRRFCQLGVVPSNRGLPWPGPVVEEAVHLRQVTLYGDARVSGRGGT